MLGRLKITTMLITTLFIFCALQLLTSGLYVYTVERGSVSFRQVLSLNERNLLLSNIWSNFSQARLGLSRALIPGRSDNEIDSLLDNAIKSLKKVESDWEKFNSTPNVHGQIRKKFGR